MDNIITIPNKGSTFHQEPCNMKFYWMVSQWEHLVHATMMQVYVKIYCFIIKANDLFPIDLWEEMMESDDEIGPKQYRNKRCYNAIFECPYFHFPLVVFLGHDLVYTLLFLMSWSSLFLGLFKPRLQLHSPACLDIYVHVCIL